MDAGVCDALMLAYAGVKRMEYEDMIVKVFPEQQFIPPVGQGCIAVEASINLDALKKENIRAIINNEESENCLVAERSFLRKLEGGCSIPAFGYATQSGDSLSLTCGLAGLDGSKILQETVTGAAADAVKIGEIAGQKILDAGGRQMLAEIKSQQC